LPLAIIGARARKRRRFLLGLADNGAGRVPTLSASVLAIIVPRPPTEDLAHNPRQQDSAGHTAAGRSR
jgi:hypothetical protein